MPPCGPASRADSADRRRRAAAVSSRSWRALRVRPRQSASRTTRRLPPPSIVIVAPVMKPALRLTTKGDQVGEFLGRADPAHGHVAADLRRSHRGVERRFLAPVRQALAHAAGVEITRRDEIHANAVRRKARASVFASPATPRRMTVESTRWGGGSRAVDDPRMTMSPPLLARIAGRHRRASRTQLISSRSNACCHWSSERSSKPPYSMCRS